MTSNNEGRMAPIAGKATPAQPHGSRIAGDRPRSGPSFSQANDQPFSETLGFFSRCENTACRSSEALSSSRLSLLSIWSM